MRTVRKIATYVMAGTLAFAGHAAVAEAAETPVAGVDLLLSEFYLNPLNADLEMSAFDLLNADGQDTRLAFAGVDNYVNIRSKPTTEGKILGKLYKDCAATILGKENDWYRVESGTVKGYIKAEFLITGDEAEKFAEATGSTRAIVNTATLRVREKASTDSPILTLIPIGEEYKVTKKMDGWVKIIIDESTSGYVSNDFIKLNKVYDEAISIEEEQAKLEKEAIRLMSVDNSSDTPASSVKSDSSSGSSGTKSSGSSSSNQKSSVGSSSSGSSSLRNRLVDYALRFEGNPYVWGGTSLTGGADCSGFTQSVFEDFGIYIPRTSKEQAASGRSVHISEIRPGDLIFYRRNGTINHVALYIGNGKVIGAKSSGEGIRITGYNYRTPYKAVRYIS